MERPSYDEQISRQNDIYAMEIIERARDKQKTASELLSAIQNAFIIGAGGYEGSFDAALVLEYGGMEVLLDSLGLSDLDKDLSAPIDDETFENTIRASVDFGASWDELEEEIPSGAIGDTQLTGESPFLGPIAGKFVIQPDEPNRPNWLDD